MKGRNSLFIAFFFSLLTVIQADIASAAEKMVMVSVKGDDHPEGKFYSQIYKEAFKRMGMELVYEQYPSKRCSYLADSGMVDGEMERVYDYNTSHPNLVRIEEPLKIVNFVALTINPDINLDGWDSLKGTDHKVVYRRGLKKCEEKLSYYLDAKKFNAIDDASVGLKRLAAGWFDLYIDREVIILQLLKNKEFSSLNIRIAGVMEKVTTHGFLYKKHANIALRLSAVFKEMKKEGLFEKYMSISGLNKK